MQRGDATFRQVVNHLLDLPDFFAGDVVVVDARVDAHGAAQGMGHAFGHAQGEGVFLVAGQARQMALGLYLTMHDKKGLVGISQALLHKICEGTRDKKEPQ